MVRFVHRVLHVISLWVEIACVGLHGKPAECVCCMYTAHSRLECLAAEGLTLQVSGPWNPRRGLQVCAVVALGAPPVRILAWTLDCWDISHIIGCTSSTTQPLLCSPKWCEENLSVLQCIDPTRVLRPTAAQDLSGSCYEMFTGVAAVVKGKGVRPLCCDTASY